MIIIVQNLRIFILARTFFSVQFKHDHTDLVYKFHMFYQNKVSYLKIDGKQY
jgi:hypothetical protein